MVPLIAVTVMEYVPVGVPGSVMVMVLPPPPHAPRATDTKATENNAKTSFDRRFFIGIASSRRPTRRATPLAIRKSGLLKRAPKVCGAVVVIVTVVLPLVTIEEGFAEQVASLIVAGTAQLRATVPVNPGPEVTATEAVPDWPGAEMVKLVAFADRLKPGTTVTVSGADVEAR